MKEPVWLTEAVLLAVQEDMLARFGGLSGLRDEGLLHSALSRPRNRFGYAKSTIFELETAVTAVLAIGAAAGRERRGPPSPDCRVLCLEPCREFCRLCSLGLIDRFTGTLTRPDFPVDTLLGALQVPFSLISNGI